MTNPFKRNRPGSFEIALYAVLITVSQLHYGTNHRESLTSELSDPQAGSSRNVIEDNDNGHGSCSQSSASGNNACG